MLKIEVPNQVQKIIRVLEENGYEAYAVGGCVRDACLGRVPHDWDITTSAKPGEIKELFTHTVDTGIAHGTVTVLLGGGSYEVTTYRIDGVYEDARHPKQVTFTPDLREDLRRRDFTINAMAYNDRNGLVDLFGGREDLERKVIRCVGDAGERFSEDALRILRAVRFSAQLNFSIDPDTERAAAQLAQNLRKISVERIAQELIKLLISDHPEKLRRAYELGITGMFLPEFDQIMNQRQDGPHHIYTVGVHTLHTVMSIRPDPILRLTMLLHDMGKLKTARQDAEGIWHFPDHAAYSAQMAEEILRRLKLDNQTIFAVKRLTAWHSAFPGANEVSVRHAVHDLGEELFPAFLEVKRADILAQSPAVQKTRLPWLDEVQEIYRRIMDRGDCLSMKTLAISGRDLLADGMKGGKTMGSVLEALLDDVLTTPEHNDRAYLLERSRLMRQC